MNLKLELKPIDTFTFRDHRDFQAGENTMGFTFSFPTPSTIYGALRSAYIYQHSNFDSFAKEEDSEIKRWMGSPSSYGKFKILGTFIEHQGETYFPVPYDMQIVKKEENTNTEIAIPLKLVKEKARSSDERGYRLFAQSSAKSGGGEQSFITKNNLRKVLKGETSQATIKKISDFIDTNHKIGISINQKTKTAEKHMFYQIEMSSFITPKDTFFSTYLEEAPNFNEVKFARIGGRGRPWLINTNNEHLKLLDKQDKESLKEQIKKTGIAKITFLTPTIFNNGTKPLIDGDEKLILNDNLHLEVITIATGRPIVIGGFDLVRKRPKPRQNSLPAGTVIYVKVPSNQVDELVKIGALGVLTDKLNKEGYGLFTLGVSEIK